MSAAAEWDNGTPFNNVITPDFTPDGARSSGNSGPADIVQFPGTANSTSTKWEAEVLKGGLSGDDTTQDIPRDLVLQPTGVKGLRESGIAPSEEQKAEAKAAANRFEALEVKPPLTGFARLVKAIKNSPRSVLGTQRIISKIEESGLAAYQAKGKNPLAFLRNLTGIYLNQDLKVVETIKDKDGNVLQQFEKVAPQIKEYQEKYKLTESEAIQALLGKEIQAKGLQMAPHLLQLHKTKGIPLQPGYGENKIPVIGDIYNFGVRAWKNGSFIDGIKQGLTIGSLGLSDSAATIARTINMAYGPAVGIMRQFHTNVEKYGSEKEALSMLLKSIPVTLATGFLTYFMMGQIVKDTTELYKNVLMDRGMAEDLAKSLSERFTPMIANFSTRTVAARVVSTLLYSALMAKGELKDKNGNVIPKGYLARIFANLGKANDITSLGAQSATIMGAFEMLGIPSSEAISKFLQSFNNQSPSASVAGGSADLVSSNTLNTNVKNLQVTNANGANALAGNTNNSPAASGSTLVAGSVGSERKLFTDLNGNSSNLVNETLTAGGKTTQIDANSAVTSSNVSTSIDSPDGSRRLLPGGISLLKDSESIVQQLNNPGTQILQTVKIGGIDYQKIEVDGVEYLVNSQTNLAFKIDANAESFISGIEDGTEITRIDGIALSRRDNFEDELVVFTKKAGGTNIETATDVVNAPGLTAVFPGFATGAKIQFNGSAFDVRMLSSGEFAFGDTGVDKAFDLENVRTDAALNLTVARVTLEEHTAAGGTNVINQGGMINGVFLPESVLSNLPFSPTFSNTILPNVTFTTPVVTAGAAGFDFDGDSTNDQVFGINQTDLSIGVDIKMDGSGNKFFNGPGGTTWRLVNEHQDLANKMFTAKVYDSSGVFQGMMINNIFLTPDQFAAVQPGLGIPLNPGGIPNILNQNAVAAAFTGQPFVPGAVVPPGGAAAGAAAQPPAGSPTGEVVLGKLEDGRQGEGGDSPIAFLGRFFLPDGVAPGSFHTQTAIDYFRSTAGTPLEAGIRAELAANGYNIAQIDDFFDRTIPSSSLTMNAAGVGVASDSMTISALNYFRSLPPGTSEYVAIESKLKGLLFPSDFTRIIDPNSNVSTLLDIFDGRPNLRANIVGQISAMYHEEGMAPGSTAAWNNGHMALSPRTDFKLPIVEAAVTGPGGMGGAPAGLGGGPGNGGLFGPIPQNVMNQPFGIGGGGMNFNNRNIVWVPPELLIGAAAAIGLGAGWWWAARQRDKARKENIQLKKSLEETTNKANEAIKNAQDAAAKAAAPTPAGAAGGPPTPATGPGAAGSFNPGGDNNIGRIDNVGNSPATATTGDQTVTTGDQNVTVNNDFSGLAEAFKQLGEALSGGNTATTTTTTTNADGTTTTTVVRAPASDPALLDAIEALKQAPTQVFDFLAKQGEAQNKLIQDLMAQAQEGMTEANAQALKNLREMADQATKHAQTLNNEKVEAEKKHGQELMKTMIDNQQRLDEARDKAQKAEVELAVLQEKANNAPTPEQKQELEKQITDLQTQLKEAEESKTKQIELAQAEIDAAYRVSQERDRKLKPIGKNRFEFVPSIIPMVEMERQQELFDAYTLERDKIEKKMREDSGGKTLTPTQKKAARAVAENHVRDLITDEERQEVEQRLGAKKRAKNGATGFPGKEDVKKKS